MHVLIAGVGWLGRAVASECLARGWRVSGVKRRAEGIEDLLRMGVEPVLADLADPGAGERLPRDVEAIVACQAPGDGSMDAYRATYIDVTSTLLDLGRRAGARAFVYTSSTGVFGQRDGSDVDEATPVLPVGRSAEILVEAEDLVRHSAAVPACIVRLSGLYGPERIGTIDRVRRGALALGPGDDGWMNFCHRADAAASVLAALERGRPGAAYHASDASPTRRRDVVLWIAERLGIAPAVSPDAASLAPAGRGGANRRILAEQSRAELGITLLYPSFREGLAPFLSSHE